MTIVNEVMKRLFAEDNVLLHEGYYWLHKDLLQMMEMSEKSFRDALCEMLKLDPHALLGEREDYILGIRARDLRAPETFAELKKITPEEWPSVKYPHAQAQLEDMYSCKVEEKEINGKTMLVVPISVFPNTIDNGDETIKANYTYYTLEMKSQLAEGLYKPGVVVSVFEEGKDPVKDLPVAIAIDKEIAEKNHKADTLDNIEIEELMQSIRSRYVGPLAKRSNGGTGISL
jgi:hypothetical protein